MKCSNCGAFNPDGFTRCGICTGDLVSSPSAEAPVSASPIASQPPTSSLGANTLSSSPAANGSHAPVTVYPGPDSPGGVYNSHPGAEESFVPQVPFHPPAAPQPEIAPPFQQPTPTEGAGPWQPGAIQQNTNPSYVNGYREPPPSVAPAGYAPMNPTAYMPAPPTPTYGGYAGAQYPAYGGTFAGHAGGLEQVPPEAKKWNWGAFLLTIPWGIAHRVWIAFASFIPLAGIAVPFYLGAKGGEMAWKNKEWSSPDHFKKTQRAWAVAGAVVSVIFLILFLISTAIPDDGTGVAADGSSVLTSDNGKVQLTVPEGWTKVTEGVSVDAAITVASADEEFGAVVIVEPKSDFSNFGLAQFAEVALKTTMDGLKDPKIIGGPRDGNVGGNAALQYEVTGVVDEHYNGVFIHTSVETPLDFAQVIVYSSNSKFEENRQTLHNIIAGVRIS